MPNTKLQYLAATLVGAVIAFALPALADGDKFVEIGGKRYLQRSDGVLLPQIKSEWEDIHGHIHVNWYTDYSKAPPIVVQSGSFKTRPQNFNVTSPSFNTKSVAINAKGINTTGANMKAGSDIHDATSNFNIQVEDAGCRHKISVGADALFDFDKFDLTPTAESTLNQVLPILIKYGEHPISIEGHTDSVGTDEYNQSLSEKRSATVKQWLIDHNFVAPDIAVVGYGEQRPIAPNTYNDGTDYPQGRQRNRRVEIIVDTCK